MSTIVLDEQDREKLATFLGQGRLIRTLIDSLADLTKEMGRSEMAMWDHLMKKYDLSSDSRYKINWGKQTIESIE